MYIYVLFNCICYLFFDFNKKDEWFFFCLRHFFCLNRNKLYIPSFLFSVT